MKLKSVLVMVLAGLFLVACEDGGKGTPNILEQTFNYNLSQQPTTLNVLSSSDAYATRVQIYVVEGLAKRNIDTYEWEPALATKWDISEDGTTYTFTLREGVKWHDGKPLTAQDVKFSFDAIVDPENKYSTAHMKPYYENIESCEILEDGRIQFKVKNKYYGNFNVVAGLSVVPRHLYENPSEEQKKQLNKTLVGTGPYTLENWKRGKYIILKKNPNWWGNTVYPKENNFEMIRMRFIKEGNIAIQRLENGDLDFNSMTAEEFTKKTQGEKWGKSVKKVKIENLAPKGYTFIGWNLKNDLFKDRDIRLALYHLIDREKMIEKYDYGLTLPAIGPWYLQSMFADKSVKPIPFDPKKALQILRKNGWKDTDGDQILDKVINGKKTPFRFTILEPLKEYTKYLVTFQQDAKKAGIDVQIKVVEWNTFITLLNERKFEAVRLAWGGGSVDLDPKQIWHSSSSKSKGSNFVSYENPKVDKLIDQARKMLKREERIPLLQEVYRTIANDVPYAFLFNPKYGFYGYNERMVREKDTYKYDVGLDHWKIQAK
ncbi:MAG: ABC transporter substrate-binding protein [Bdellovibrionota bacterium]|nr:ABC transporter substrate-binding protein [Bdellovibrionota bacterium]